MFLGYMSMRALQHRSCPIFISPVRTSCCLVVASLTGTLPTKPSWWRCLTSVRSIRVVASPTGTPHAKTLLWRCLTSGRSISSCSLTEWDAPHTFAGVSIISRDDTSPVFVILEWDLHWLSASPFWLHLCFGSAMATARCLRDQLSGSLVDFWGGMFLACSFWGGFLDAIPMLRYLGLSFPCCACYVCGRISAVSVEMCYKVTVGLFWGCVLLPRAWVVGVVISFSLQHDY